ncbi:MAG TPA: cupin domain-containing protein [Burkholderiales bacterium]|nr:cupin domain-containing protein [Burkholderiales bacterium]
MDRDKIEKDWARRGFSCDLWVDPPGQTWEGYVHDVDEVVMVLEGDVEFEFLGKTFRPSVGEELIIPARATHGVRNVGPSTSRWLYGYKNKSATT